MLSSSSLDLNRNRTMRSPSDRVNALKRGSIRGVQGLLNNPYNGSFAASDGRLSPTPSYATSINEVSCDLGGRSGPVWSALTMTDRHCVCRFARFRIQPVPHRYQGARG
jgi:hypothetical protein